ncbi:MAG: flagellar hook-associated protein FlgL [bacterium]|nr:flagellar hook-associated protein FlgL [bacterium]
MRISTTLFSRNFMDQVEQGQERLFWNNQRISSTKRIQKPSDDPIGTDTAMKTRVNIDANNQYIENSNNALSWLDATEVSANNLLDSLTSASDFATYGATDTIGADTRKAVANEVNQLIEEFVDTANAQVKGKYLFGGFQTLDAPYETEESVTDQNISGAAYDTPISLTPPARMLEGTTLVTDTTGTITYTEGTDYTVDYDTGTITILSTGGMLVPNNYLIDYNTQISSITRNPQGIDGNILRQISESETITINITGNEIFKPTGGVDAFQALINLRDALYADDTAGIETAMGQLDDSRQTVRAGLETIGSRLERLNSHVPQLEEMQISRQAELSRIEDTDMVYESVELQKNQLALQAALQSGANIMQLSLVNFLK